MEGQVCFCEVPSLAPTPPLPLHIELIRDTWGQDLMRGKFCRPERATSEREWARVRALESCNSAVTHFSVTRCTLRHRYRVSRFDFSTLLLHSPQNLSICEIPETSICRTWHPGPGTQSCQTCSPCLPSAPGCTTVCKIDENVPRTHSAGSEPTSPPCTGNHLGLPSASRPIADDLRRANSDSSAFSRCC